MAPQKTPSQIVVEGFLFVFATIFSAQKEKTVGLGQWYINLVQSLFSGGWRKIFRGGNLP